MPCPAQMLGVMPAIHLHHRIWLCSCSARLLVRKILLFRLNRDQGILYF
jgi:hypothetical protein